MKDDDKDIFDVDNNKIGYYRKLEDGKDGINLYEVYYDDREDKGDYLQSDEFKSTDDEAEETAYDYARSVI
jgi:hypothetical protein